MSEQAEMILAAVRGLIERADAQGCTFEYREEAGTREAGSKDGFVVYELDGSYRFAFTARPKA